MKTWMALGAVLGVLVSASAALLWGASEAPAIRPEAGRTGTQVSGWTVISTNTDRVQQLVVVDPSIQSMAVYHVDLSSGRIALKSVRNIRYDLLMTEFNTDVPSPRELESLWKTP